MNVRTLKVVETAIYGAVAGTVAGAMLGLSIKAIRHDIAWLNIVLAGAVVGIIEAPALTVLRDTLSGKENDERAIAILGATEGGLGCANAGMAVGIVLWVTSKNIGGLILIVILAVAGAIWGATQKVQHQRRWNAAITRNPELMALYYQLGDGALYNPIARRATFRSEASVKVFREAAPDWRVKCMARRK